MTPAVEQLDWFMPTQIEPWCCKSKSCQTVHTHYAGIACDPLLFVFKYFTLLTQIQYCLLGWMMFSDSKVIRCDQQFMNPVHKYFVVLFLVICYCVKKERPLSQTQSRDSDMTMENVNKLMKWKQSCNPEFLFPLVKLLPFSSVT